MNEADYDHLVKEHGWTSLLEACSEEDYDRVLELIQNGADVNVTDKFGVTPLDRAVRYAYKNEEAAAKIVTLLLENKANINAQNIDGETALMQAVYYRYRAIARMLIEHGADVNLRRTDGDTIISSIERAAPSTVKMLKRMIKMIEEAGGVR